MQNLQQVSAFVLHSRAFQENSLIIQVFSLELGRFSLIAKGIKGKRSMARKAQLQPFQKLLIEFTGKSDLKTLIHCELTAAQPVSILSLQGQALACAYYASELVLRGLPEGHEYPELFHFYSVLNKIN